MLAQHVNQSLTDQAGRPQDANSSLRLVLHRYLPFNSLSCDATAVFIRTLKVKPRAAGVPAGPKA
jgi:hypothetical protein